MGQVSQDDINVLHVFVGYCRYLSEEELTDYSGCEKHVEMRGDLVTPDTVFQVTGKLIKKIEIPVTEALCTRKTNKKIVNIHVPFLRFSEAVNSCNKFSAGSIIGDFQAIYNIYNDYIFITQLYSRTSLTGNLSILYQTTIQQ